MIFMSTQYNEQFSQQSLQQPTGQLSIVSIPSGANIFIDGIKQTETTPFITTIPIGQHVYRLIYPGYIDEDGMVLIQENQTYDLFVTLHKSFDTRDEIIYGFIGSLAAGVALYLLIKDRTKSYA